LVIIDLADLMAYAIDVSVGFPANAVEMTPFPPR
jgi:hypothetical protein